MHLLIAIFIFCSFFGSGSRGLLDPDSESGSRSRVLKKYFKCEITTKLLIAKNCFNSVCFLTCLGDSGGPLVVINQKRQGKCPGVIVGITRYSIFLHVF